MIFVTVGNDFRPFDRLIKKMDEIAPLFPGPIVIQTGCSGYPVQNATHFDFVPFDTALEYIKNSQLVVSHAGIGTIILCKEYGIPILIFPRKKKYGEHMNDHQLEIAGALERRGDENVYVVYEEDQLKERILSVSRTALKPSPALNAGKNNLVRAIRQFLEASCP